MRVNFPSPILGWLAESEGGYVDHPRDPGGATNRGVTQAVYDEWRGGAVKRPVRYLTDFERDAIYRKLYWNKVRGDDLPSGVDYAVFDSAVNSGVGQSARWLQRAAGVADDGIIGPITLAAVNADDPDTLIMDIITRRMAFLRQLSTWSTFGRGWTERVASVRLRARDLAVTKPAEPNRDDLAALLHHVSAEDLARELLRRVVLKEPA